MANLADDRLMASERIAPGMLPRVLNSTDMTIIFVAIVLFIVNASAIQRAGPAAYTFWILGFVAFLIPGALVTAQLGLMFPQEGSLYVWTQKALGPFWGFFAGFCAWWPGILVMTATGDAVVTIWQFIDTGGLPTNWEQGLVILAVLWFSAVLSVMRLRMTQNYANVAVIFYGAAIFVIGLAGILWLIGDGHSATGGFGTFDNWVPQLGLMFPEPGAHDGHPARRRSRVLGLARVRGAHRAHPHLVLLLEHRRLQLLVQPPSVRLGTRAPNAGGNRSR